MFYSRWYSQKDFTDKNKLSTSPSIRIAVSQILRTIKCHHTVDKAVKTESAKMKAEINQLIQLFKSTVIFWNCILQTATINWKNKYLISKYFPIFLKQIHRTIILFAVLRQMSNKNQIFLTQNLSWSNWNRQVQLHMLHSSDVGIRSTLRSVVWTKNFKNTSKNFHSSIKISRNSTVLWRFQLDSKQTNSNLVKTFYFSEGILLHSSSICWTIKKIRL